MRLNRSASVLLAAGTVLLAGLVAPAPAAAAPQVGACYDYKAAVLDEVSTPASAVDCNELHTAETYYVGRVGDSFGLPSQASLARILAAGQPCTVKAMNTYLGVPDRVLPSRFQTAVLFPTDEQWAAGERWVRCDVVLQGGLQLRPFRGTAAALVASAPPEQFDFCTPGEPNARATAAFPCRNPKKNWIKVLDRELGGPGTSFPGSSTVERKTRAICERQGKVWDGKVEFPGWWGIWPTQVGWKEGTRTAQCFVPYQQYLNELKSRRPKPTPAPTPAPEPTPQPTVDPQPPAA